MKSIKIILIISVALFSGSVLSEETQNISEETQTPVAIPQIPIPEQVNKQDVINMVKSGVSDEVIVSRIKATNSYIKLTNEEIIELRQAGVSNELINFIVETKVVTGIPKGILVSTPPPVITTSINFYPYPDPWYDPWYSSYGWWGYPYYRSYWYGGGYYYGGHHGGHHGKHHGGGHGGGGHQGGGGHGGGGHGGKH